MWCPGVGEDWGRREVVSSRLLKLNSSMLRSTGSEKDQNHT